jgi:hypothetical protein
MVKISFRQRRLLAWGSASALAAIMAAACSETGTNPIAPAAVSSEISASTDAVSNATTASTSTSAALSATTDDCTATLKPTSKRISGIVNARFSVRVSFSKAKNPGGCRWSFDSVDHIPIIVYGNHTVVGYKGSGNSDITIDLPASVRRSNTQTRKTISTVFELKGPKNTVKFTLTADRWCPERNWC